MSELSDAQRRRLHAMLQALETELAASIDERSDREEVVDLDLPQGRVSRMDALQQQQMAAAERRKREVRLGAVRTALERWDDDPDSFGSCARCGEDIAWGRLQLLPESPFCVPCLSARERA